MVTYRESLWLTKLPLLSAGSRLCAHSCQSKKVRGLGVLTRTQAWTAARLGFAQGWGNRGSDGRS